MKFKELVILLPCHSLEDFPVHNEGDEAQGLLAAWTALWHPNLIAAAAAPTWSRVDDPPTELADRLMVAPAVSTHELPTGFAQRVKDEGGLLIRKKNDRDEIVQAALEALDDENQPASPELVAEFHALGYAFLQVELLTRQMRYASNLDELHFNNLVERAAEKAVTGDDAGATEQIEACYDILTQERDHYYAVDSYFLDLTLTTSTTLGEPLRKELETGEAVSLLLTASDLETMAANHPETLEALKKAIDEKRACVVGGEWNEDRWPLMSLESMRLQWRRAHAAYEKHLGIAPKVYGRRRFGLTPSMPMLLQGMGYDGALHSTLDEGRFPQGVQTKTRWESLDGAVLDAIARPPLDASKPDTFLALAMKLGETMDSDHVATLVFAHWPGQRSQWLDDMHRVAKFHSPLGKFMRADEYFVDTDLPSNLDRFEFDQYRSPYLRQAVIRRQTDPISSSIRYWKRRHQLESAETLASLAACIQGSPKVGIGCEVLAARIDAAAEADIASDESLDADLEQALETAVEQAANALPAGSDESTGVMILNPQCAARRTRISTETLTSPPTCEKPVYAVSTLKELPQAVADTPAWGFTWVAAGNGAAGPRKKKTPPLGEQESGSIVLRNEFFEAVINGVSGTLSALYTYKSRGNRLSQQLVLRSPIDSQEQDDLAYTVMAADEARLLYASETEAVAECRGRLLDREGQRLAGFVQRYTIGRGQRVLGLEFEIEADQEPKADPWNSYYACRIAWPDETSPVARTVQQMRVESEARRFESPHYVQIGAENSLTILTGGLPFHRRTDYRKLDSILITRGETQRSFKMGIGIDLKNPMQEAIALLAPPLALPQRRGGPQPAHSSWLFHVDSRSVIATHFSAVESDGKTVGCRVRLLETNGRTTRTQFKSFREITSARQLDLRGEPVAQMDCQDGGVLVQLAPNEWIDIEARWEGA